MFLDKKCLNIYQKSINKGQIGTQNIFKMIIIIVITEMAQTIIDFDDPEEEIILSLKKLWGLSKNRTVKRIVAEYRKPS